MMNDGYIPGASANILIREMCHFGEVAERVTMTGMGGENNIYIN